MNEDLEVMGYKQVYDYTQYSHDNEVNVIPENAFKRLVSDTFQTITNVMKRTYGPYGSTMMLNEMNQTTTTKDGYNVFSAMGFSNMYKRMVYLAISKIINRVNNTVGDGTTSCILLAAKIFDELNNAITDKEKKRTVFECLSEIEKELTKPIEPHEVSTLLYVSPLHMDSLKNLLSVANNYDDNLSDIIYNALDPQHDEDGNITFIRNVIVEAKPNSFSTEQTTFNVDYIPGDYRVGVNIDVELAKIFSNKTTAKIALYNHIFGDTDWNGLIADNDPNEVIIVMCPRFKKDFMDTTYVRYATKTAMQKLPLNIILCEIHAANMQDEINDLAAILGTKAIDLNNNLHVQNELLPVAEIEIYNNNVMCFYTDKVPETYIDKLKETRDADDTKSMVKLKQYNDRIKALSLSSKNSVITVNATSSLECKMITDKIDDCVCAAESAFEYGCVPNLLQYAYRRLNDYGLYKSEDIVTSTLCVCHAIKNLTAELFASKFEDWDEKYDLESYMYKALDTGLYDMSTKTINSYDLIHEKNVPVCKLPTSAQYDLEVVSAAISIVKYLLTSNALIFDACLTQQTGDRCRIVQQQN